MLGCNQPQAESLFADLLARAANRDNPPSGALGMLVSGDFGSGKSHLLTHLEHQALSQHFVCSRVAISKETPLYDLGKVFKSAVENGQMPDRSGRLIEELVHALNLDSSEYADFFHWANDANASGLSQIFPASLHVHEESNDLELNNVIESFWAGSPISVATVRGGLRQIGQVQSYSFRAPKAADLPPQRLRFAIELIKAAGYKGWVVLLDEIELVGSYSLLQRGRSYAEVTRWLGQTQGEACPGLVAVGAVTDDFASELFDRREDRDKAGQRLRVRGDEGLAARAETGMRLLERECTSLRSPSVEDVQATVEKLREIYTAAYGWDAPLLEGKSRGAGFQNRMRYNVRAAINEWDLRRLYPDSRPDTVSDDFRHTYEENRDLERESRDGNGGDAPDA